MKKILIGAAILSIMILYSCKNDDNTPVLTGIQLNNNELQMNVGDIEMLKVSTEIYDNKVMWASSDENIAVINEQGELTAKAGGTITVIAKVLNLESTCKVKVDPDVFISGYGNREEGEINYAAFYWINGIAMDLTNGCNSAGSDSIFVFDRDIYVASHAKTTELVDFKSNIGRMV